MLEMEDVPRGGVESSSLLFEKAIPVRIKSPSEDRDAELTIRIIVGVSKNRRSSKVLQVQITNELDPFFLYFLEVSEEDFQSLKVDQCILVDFGTFPHKFIELLEHCIRTGTIEAPRFLAVLNVRTGDSTFSVVETNQFKHLSHLSLCFRQGNDSTIKGYLAGRLAEYKAANSDLHEKLRRTIESLENSIEDVTKLRSELGEFKEMHSRSLSDLRAKHALELSEEKRKAMEEYAELKLQLERERSDMESQLRQNAGLHEDRVAELEKQLRESATLKSNFELAVAELRTKLEALNKDLRQREEDSCVLREKNRSLNEEFQKVSKQLNESLVRLAAVEQEVQSKSELVLTMSRQLETQTSQRSSLELSLKNAQTAADRAEEKAAACLAETNSCKQTIEKLQGELKSSKAKVKLKAQVTAQQDTLLHERQAAIERSIAENNALRQELAASKSEADASRKKADDLREKYDEVQEALKSHQQMVQWLNQQLTDSQLGKYALPSSRYRPTSATSFEHSSSKALALSSLSGVPATRTSNLLLPSSTTPGSFLSSSLSSKSTKGCCSPIAKVSYKAPQVATESSKPEGDAAEGNNNSSSSSRVFTVEWKRRGMPNPQLSFASSPQEFPVPKPTIGRGMAEEITAGGRFPSRASSVVST